MVAELDQGDNYTKRARPTIAYAGLAFILLDHVLLPYISFFSGREVPDITLPADFWYVWGAVCSVWAIGRTMEKRGSMSKVTKMITGS